MFWEIDTTVYLEIFRKTSLILQVVPFILENKLILRNTLILQASYHAPPVMAVRAAVHFYPLAPTQLHLLHPHHLHVNHDLQPRRSWYIHFYEMRLWDMLVILRHNNITTQTRKIFESVLFYFLFCFSDWFLRLERFSCHCPAY